LSDGELAEAIEEPPVDSTRIKAQATASTGRRLPAEKQTTPTPASGRGRECV